MPVTDFPIPASLSSDFALSLVTPQDVEGIVSCHHAAYNTPEERFWWSHDLEAMHKYQQGSVGKNLERPERRYYKIVHVPSGQLVAWSAWVLPKAFQSLGGVPQAPASEVVAVGGGNEVPSVNPEEIEEKKEEPLTAAEKVKKIMEVLNTPEGTAKQTLAEVIVLEGVMHDKYKTEEMILLGVLSVHPDFERRGLARSLVQPMLDIAEVEGIPVWVDASPKGLGFYEKLSFVTKDITEIDLSRGNKGLTGTQIITSMIWEPRGSTEHKK